MKLSISVLIVVGLVICPFINATATSEGANATEREVDAPVPSPFRAESRAAAEEDEDEEDFDINDIMSIFGGPSNDNYHVKRSSMDYYVDMDMAASSPKEQQYQWKTAQPKSSGTTKKNSNGNMQLKGGNGKVYTLHIVTNGEQNDSNGQSRSNSNTNNNNHHHHHYNNHNNGVRARSPRSKIHVIPITMRANGKSSNGKPRIVKRFRGTRPDDHHVKYDSHSHSEEIQDIILPAESEVHDTKYENKYDAKFEIVGPKEMSSNDLKQAEGSKVPESQYLDHDPYDDQEKVKVKHHHHHHHHNHVKTMIKRVPQPYPVEKIVHVPVERIVTVPKPYPVDKFVEKIVHVPVERVIQVPRPVPVDRIVEKVVHVPKPYPVDRIVEKQVPVNRPVRVNVPYPVEKIVHVPKPYPVEKIVEKLVHVPKPYPVIKHIHVPVPVEKRVPYPVKVEVEKKVPYPVKVYIPKPYPVEKKMPDVESPPKKNSYRTNFEKNRLPGVAQSFQNINHGHYQHSGRETQQQQHHHQQQTQTQNQQQPQFSSQASSQQFDQQNYVPQMTGMDYGFAQQTQQYPYQYEPTSSAEMQQYGVNVMAGQPTGQETEQPEYMFSGNEQQQSMGPSAAGGSAASASDSVDAASSDSVVNVAASVGGDEAGSSSPSFQINVPDHTPITEPQFGESKTVSHLLQITPFTSDSKTMAYTRPVDQFVVFHTGTGFTVPK